MMTFTRYRLLGVGALQATFTPI
ncbi:hypothetical protein NC652_022085 [Populus alba x Populus x berolinensis]|nr:hypothetical protein NC652_022085 [Populus alba x Populus x berolinensis]